MEQRVMLTIFIRTLIYSKKNIAKKNLEKPNQLRAPVRTKMRPEWGAERVFMS